MASEQPLYEHKPNQAEKEYLDFVMSSIGPFTLILGMLVCFLLQVNGDDFAPAFMMTREEADALAPPIARLLAKQKFSTEVRKRILGSTDIAAIIIASGSYALRVSETVKQIASIKGVNKTNGNFRRAKEVPATDNIGNGNNGYSETVDFIGSQYKA